MIYGERVRLRAAERDDLPRFVTWLNDPEVRQYLLINRPLSMAQEEHWFENMQKQPASEQVLVIEVKAGEEWKPIGNVSFNQIDWINRSAEIGIFIGEKPFWSQGYGRETMKVMLKYGFDTLNLNRIFLRVFEHNKRGIRAYEYAGFQHEGRLRQAQYLDGCYCDVLLMSVLRSEWQNEKAASNGPKL
jgi:diamine N-acetyltransferase